MTFSNIGQIPIKPAFGGTGLTTTPSAGQILVSNGTSYQLVTLSGNGITFDLSSSNIQVNNSSSFLITTNPIDCTAPFDNVFDFNNSVFIEKVIVTGINVGPITSTPVIYFGSTSGSNNIITAACTGITSGNQSQLFYATGTTPKLTSGIINVFMHTQAVATSYDVVLQLVGIQL